ncbi:MAG TPA: hypothetical protein VN665_03005, partial [Candidatus Paceibacterota bacterium]|nr:hypothetical protein [Candidatus Paceibacterota bacterium]
MKKQNENTRFLIDHNKKQSELYQSPDEVVRREEYLRVHKTEIMVPKCMDGRVNVPLITGIPMGIIAPYRSMGARFEIGSPSFAPHVRRFYEHVRDQRIENGVACGIVVTTYHYSKGDTHR